MDGGSAHVGVAWFPTGDMVTGARRVSPSVAFAPGSVEACGPISRPRKRDVIRGTDRRHLTVLTNYCTRVSPRILADSCTTNPQDISQLLHQDFLKY